LIFLVGVRELSSPNRKDRDRPKGGLDLTHVRMGPNRFSILSKQNSRRTVDAIWRWSRDDKIDPAPMEGTALSFREAWALEREQWANVMPISNSISPPVLFAGSVWERDTR
jgi:hypothetical protein